jgi:copper chaperone
MSQTTIKIIGMRCGGCSGRVKKALAALPGVTQAEVALDTGTAVIDYDEKQIPDAKLFADTVTGLGFKLA